MGVQWPSRARPDASPKRPCAPKTPQDRFFVDFWSIKDGLSWTFERFLVDFRSSRVRRRHKSRISKRSRVVLGASFGSCVGQSLRTARTSFEITFERCVFSFFYCVPQRIPCFSANPETATFRIHVRCLLLRLLPFITSINILWVVNPI